MLDKKGVNGGQDKLKDGRGRMLDKECVNGERVDNDKKYIWRMILRIKI